MSERRIIDLIEERQGIHRQWYTMRENGGSMMTITRNDAQRLNEDGFGIFQSVNEFNGARRKDNLVRLLSWAIDIDKGEKEEQEQLINDSPLTPSLVVETKRGHHVYWNTESINPFTYQSILEDRLIPHFFADKNAKDISRVLRVPGFYHCKDLKSKFLVSVVSWSVAKYSDKIMEYAFKRDDKEEVLVKKRKELRHVFTNGNGLWERVYNMDCENALNRLSGSDIVGGEVYTFRRVSNGNLNIYVDGKSSSCFIDKNKRIGSLSGGGPTIYNWLKWFGRSNFQVVQTMKYMFPELWR